MAARKPLVLGANGRPQQLQPGDTLNAVVSGGEQISLTNDEASPVVCGAPVYVDAANGFKKAQANAAATAEPIGLVATAPSIANGVAGAVQVSGLLTLTTVQWDAVTGGTGGLTPNTNYFLDPATAGKLTSTAPSTAGQLVNMIGKATSTTDLDIQIAGPILL